MFISTCGIAGELSWERCTWVCLSPFVFLAHHLYSKHTKMQSLRFVDSPQFQIQLEILTNPWGCFWLEIELNALANSLHCYRLYLGKRPLPHKIFLTSNSPKAIKKNPTHYIVQELCDSRGGRPGLSVLTSLLVSVDVKLYWTMLRHWFQLVPNTSTDIWGH